MPPRVHGVLSSMAPCRHAVTLARGEDQEEETMLMLMLARGYQGAAEQEGIQPVRMWENFEPNPQPLSHQMSTKMGKLMSRAAQQMSRSPVIRRADRNTPQAMSGVMTRCRRVADHTTTAPSVNLQNGGLKDELVLNFTGPSAVPSTSDLVKIFSQFGPIKEARAENSVAVVIFKRSMDAETAFSGTVKIRALSANLISFRLTYSLPAAAPAKIQYHVSLTGYYGNEEAMKEVTCFCKHTSSKKVQNY